MNTITLDDINLESMRIYCDYAKELMQILKKNEAGQYDCNREAVILKYVEVCQQIARSATKMAGRFQ